MFNIIGCIAKKMMCFLLCCASLCFADGEINITLPSTGRFDSSPTTRMVKWKRFHSVSGNCSISLPTSPEHVQQVMPVAEGGYKLRYDVYVSAFERKAVYMMLVAQYPEEIGNIYTELSLENILNGLLMQNQKNKLLFADLVEVDGYKALDFFIEAKGIYFKGRVLVAKNNLYLLAMECAKQNYFEGHYNHFINSFKLLNK